MVWPPSTLVWLLTWPGLDCDYDLMTIVGDCLAHLVRCLCCAYDKTAIGLEQHLVEDSAACVCCVLDQHSTDTWVNARHHQHSCIRLVCCGCLLVERSARLVLLGHCSVVFLKNSTSIKRRIVVRVPRCLRDTVYRMCTECADVSSTANQPTQNARELPHKPAYMHAALYAHA